MASKSRLAVLAIGTFIALTATNARAQQGDTDLKMPPENRLSLTDADKNTHRISPPDSASTKVALQNYGKLPLVFEQRGPSDYVAHGPGYTVNFRASTATITAGPSDAVTMEFGGGRQVLATPEAGLPGKVNYIIGNDPHKWRVGIPTYQRIAYHELYPGIDAVFYGNQKQLEYDLVLKPEADARSLRIRFKGASKLHLDPDGSLVIGNLRMLSPKVMQGEETISAHYELVGDDEVIFDLGDYDRHGPLVIDPTLVYSTRFGGGNSANQGNAIALDAAGNAYIAGYTYASDFPTVNAAFAGYQANGDGFISKVNAAGTAFLYTTYIGGSNYDSFGGIGVDSTGAAWAVGSTTSSDFPLLDAYQNTLGGTEDAVVVKLNPDGSLAYSTFLGGPSTDQGYAVAVDSYGNAYAAGYANAGFPTTVGVYGHSNFGSYDAFVTKFNSTGGIVWSTFVGGAAYDYATGIAVDAFENTYITGETGSLSFPNAPIGGAQPTNHGSPDAFVAKLNFNASALSYFTFLGGSGYDIGQAISVNPTTGVAVVAGSTFSTDLPVTTNALQTRIAGGENGFVAKLNAAGSAFVYTTYLGGNRLDVLTGVATDSNGNAYISGYTDSNRFPTTAAIQPAVQGNSTALFRTSNSGASWTPFDTNLPGAARGFSPDPVNAGNAVVSTDTNIYQTIDGGATWQLRSTFDYLTTLARSAANPSVIYGYGGSVFQSIDDGVTWSFKGSLPVCCASGIIADPTNAAIAYAYAYNGLNSSVPAIQKTIDSGVDWTASIAGLPTTARITTMAAGSDGSLYAGLDYTLGVSPGGVYKSTDQGVSWSEINNGLPANLPVPAQGLVVSPSNSSVLYVTDYFNLYQSLNGGASWSTIGALPGGTNAIGVSSTASSTLFFAAYNSAAPIWVSTNSGATWNPATGLGVASVGHLLPDLGAGTGAYAIAAVSEIPIIAEIDTSGKNLLYASYLGDYGAAYGIVIDGMSDVLVTGSTWEIPTTSSALQRNRNYNFNNLDGFVARISDSTAACAYSIDPPQSLELWYPHLVQFVVTAPSGCNWTASSNQPWATIVSGSSGVGSGIVYVLVSNNATPSEQSAALTIGGQVVSLRQRPASCAYNAFSPQASVVPGGGGTVQFNLSAGSGCGWTVINNDPNAVTLTSDTSGTGAGQVALTVAPNMGPNTRTFIVPSPQGGSETISQAGTTAPAVVASVTSSPTGASISVIGNGCVPGNYTTPAQLTWNADTNCTLAFTNPQSINGAQYIYQSTMVDGGLTTSENPLTINSGTSPPTINVNFQAPCTYSLSPTGQSFDAQGGLASFTVTTPSYCSWQPVPSAGWITILASGSQGNGDVSFLIAPNQSAARSGTISVGGQNFNIDQTALSCTLSLSPGYTAIGANGGTSSVVVNAPTGCSWTASSNTSWLRVVSGASGAGPGAVDFYASANSSGGRNGSLTIAGQTFTVAQAAVGATSACGAIDVTSAMHYSFKSPFQDSVSWTLWHQYETITNISKSPLNGPLYLVLVGLPGSHGVGVPAAVGTTHCFSSEGDYYVQLRAPSIAPGAASTGTLDFITDIGIYIFYTPRLLIGAPSN